MKAAPSLSRTLLVWMIAVVLVCGVFSAGASWLIEYRRFRTHAVEMRDEHIDEQRELIRAETQRAVAFTRSLAASAEESATTSMADAQAEALAYFETVHFGEDGYLFAGQFDGLSLSGPAKGQNMLDVTDVDGVPIVQALIRKAQSGGGYVDYVLPAFEGLRPLRKLSYVEAVPEWGWYVGAGVYVQDTEDFLAAEAADHKARLLELFWAFAAVALALVGLSSLVVWRLGQHLAREYHVFDRFFEEVAESPQCLNPESLRFAEYRRLAMAANDMLRRREEAEEALRESEGQISSLIQNAPDAFFMHDLGGNFIEVNELACERLGYERDELLGMRVMDVDPGLDAEAIRDTWRDMGLDETVELESVHRRQDGSTFPVEVRIGAMDLGGRRVVFGFARDITQRKESEERLRRAERMESLGVLAGGIAHDFNNVLAAIMGYTELGRRRLPGDHAAQEDLEQVATAANRARGLVRQILVFSRQAEPSLAPAQLESLVREVHEFLRSSIPSTVEIRLDIRPGCGPVMVDATQIHQVLMNLCTNAHQAMGAEGGVLDIGLSPVHLGRDDAAQLGELAPGEYVCLKVSDTGCGMPTEVQSRIFEPFFTTKPPGQGTGMGLATAHGIVAGHGGTIAVHSRSGAGTTFWVYIPCQDAAADETESAADTLPSGSERIVVVDDELPLAEMAGDMLESLGYAVDVVGGGPEALELLTQHAGEIDLLVTDLAMPKLSGIRLAERAQVVQPGLRVLIVSGYVADADVEAHPNIGIVGSLLKPYDLGELAHAVRGALDGKADGPSAQAS